MKTCPTCGVVIPIGKGKGKFCDDICAEAGEQGQTREEREMKKPYPVGDGQGCPVCGLVFCMCEAE